MKGVLENGEIVKNKKDAVEKAQRLLDKYIEGAGGMENMMDDPWVYVFHVNDPELIWFSVGYVDRDVSNYVKLKGEPRSSEFYEKLDAYRARINPKYEGA